MCGHEEDDHYHHHQHPITHRKNRTTTLLTYSTLHTLAHQQHTREKSIRLSLENIYQLMWVIATSRTTKYTMHKNVYMHKKVYM